MSITMGVIILPLWVAISQWVLLLALGFFVIVAYRQIGYMLHLKDIGSERDGLPVGEKAPLFDYILANHKMNAEARLDPQGKWTLLLFADPSCISCQTALSALEHFAPTLRGTQVLVATTSEPTVIEAVEQFRDATVPISRVDRDVPTKLYQTLTTPFAYIIDPEGIIRAKGMASDEAALRKIAQKAENWLGCK
jgi:cytochrome oxidase Cu insertion factor (SCO1/SenC/PrrC family)